MCIVADFVQIIIAFLVVDTLMQNSLSLQLETHYDKITGYW